MSTIVDVSSKLGEYMLKGWVLTDRTCPKCSRVPLMRSPTTPTIHFCANCDGGPPAPSSRRPPGTSSESHPETASEGSTTASMEFTNHNSRPSTPLTEMSSALSSPIFAPPVDTAEVLRRRQQSDMASAEIGKRLLKGWAMLADECPNPQCYGIPLVRPPKTGPEKDPRKECVVCHGVYIDEIGSDGSQRLVPFQRTVRSPVPGPSGVAEDQAFPLSSRGGGQSQLAVRQTSPQLPTLFPRAELVDLNPQAALQHLDATTATLERSMLALTEKLNFFSSGNNVDAIMIGQTADAISKVSQALMHVAQLHWSERHLDHRT